MMPKINHFLKESSTKGFWTLLMAIRIIDKSELDEFKAAINSVHEKITDGKKRQLKLDQLFDQFERNFTLLGATCVEDRLQDNV